nr:lysM domain-containing GPI-anchored protein LYP6-like [Setaria viridis]
MDPAILHSPVFSFIHSSSSTEAPSSENAIDWAASTGREGRGLKGKNFSPTLASAAQAACPPFTAAPHRPPRPLASPSLRAAPCAGSRSGGSREGRWGARAGSGAASRQPAERAAGGPLHARRCWAIAARPPATAARFPLPPSRALRRIQIRREQGGAAGSEGGRRSGLAAASGAGSRRPPPCQAQLGYTLYAEIKVFEVAALFPDPAALLAANALDFEGPGTAHRILPMGLFVRVPTHCSCANGVRKSVAVRYAARPADTLATVADVVFTGFASADQIRNENSLASTDPDAPLDAGQKLVVPLPCVCFNSFDNNLSVVYLSNVVQVRDTLPAIASSYETTVTDVMNVNAMRSPVAAPGDNLAIPLPGTFS